MAGGIDWFRWHHGTVNDPKFGLVAKRAQARLCEVLAVWACLLEAASAAEDRGNAGQPDFESMDHHLGLEEGTAQRIYTCICERGLVDSTSGRLSAWEKRQPKRERVDDSSTERTREYRERQRLTKTGDAHEHGVTPRDANDGQGTAGDATCHTGTPRGEERREELSPPAAQVTPSRTRVKATKTSIADDFAISDRVRAWAAQKGFDRLEEHLQAFGRKCKASGYAYADWDAAFMEAIREDWAKLRGRMANGAAPPPDAAHTDWRASRSGIESKGEQLGLGRWDEMRFQSGQGESFAAYQKRVEQVAASRLAVESAP